MDKYIDLRALKNIAKTLTEKSTPSYYKQATHTAINVDISNEDFEVLKEVSAIDIESMAKKLIGLRKKYKIDSQDSAKFWEFLVGSRIV